MSKQQPQPQPQKQQPKVQLPKDALQRINLGHSFSEYDQVLRQAGVFVRTPALAAALAPTRGKCFFVGRRGTGKTAIPYSLPTVNKSAPPVHPQILVPTTVDINPAQLTAARQRPFKS